MGSRWQNCSMFPKFTMVMHFLAKWKRQRCARLIATSLLISAFKWNTRVVLEWLCTSVMGWHSLSSQTPLDLSLAYLGRLGRLLYCC